MAQNITIAGASYSDVPSISVTKTGGGTASFTDVSDTTATADKVVAGYYFYDASGEKRIGTLVVPSANVDSITASYTQSGTVYSTDTVESLRTDLIVTAIYDDYSTRRVTDYTLSGTLTVGTSTITVSYEGETTTFTVTVSAPAITYLYNWDLTSSLTDSVASREITLYGRSGNRAVQDSTGLHFNLKEETAYLGEIVLPGKTIEIDVSEFDFKGDSSKHVRLLCTLNTADYSAAPVSGPLIFRSGYGWTAYGRTSSSQSGTSYRAWNTDGWGSYYSTSQVNAFDGKTLKLVFGSDGHTVSLYVDGTLAGTMTNLYYNDYSSSVTNKHVLIGGRYNDTQSSGNQLFQVTITGIRVYNNI